MWSNFLDSRQPPGTKALHSISVMDWFLQEAKLMQSISVIQLVSASHSSQSRWHQPGSTMKIQGKCASLMLASWSSPQPGFEGPWGGCHKTSAQVGNFPQPLMSAALTAAIKSLHFSLPHKPHTLPLLTLCLTQKDFFSPSAICAQTTHFSASHPCYMQPWGPMFCSHQKCFLQTRELPESICQTFTAAATWITLRIPWQVTKSFQILKQTKSTSGTLTISKNSSGDPTAVTDSTATASKIQQNFTFS